MTDIPLPQGIELTPLDDNFRENPYSIYRRLREEAPVHEDTELRRFIYSKHDDVKTILRDPDLWSDPRKGNPGTFSREFLGVRDDQEPSMLMMDEPDHRRLRSLVSASFTPAAVEQWRDRTRAVVERVLNRLHNEEFDLIQSFAGPVPTIVIAEMLGIDDGMHDSFKQWSDTFVVSAFNPFPTDAQTQASEEANQALNSFLTEEIDKRRSNMGGDLISDMIRAEADGEKLTVEEMVLQANLLLVAGNVTTTDLIGNGIKALLDNPDQWEKLKADPSLIGNAIEEMLRFDSPVVNSGRIANRPMDIGGCPVGQGESMSTSLASANHDPDVYPDPIRFDIEREDTHHQSFGGGRHLCLGSHLARLEAQEAILGLMSRFPNLRQSEKGHTYHSIPSFRGMSNLWVCTG